MAREGSLEPDSFINPSLPLYLMLPVLWLQERAAKAGLLPGLLADPLLPGRALSALAGAAAVLLVGRLARRLRPGLDLGLLPAAFLAVSPGFVNLCHFATPEAWLLLGTAASLLLAIEHLEGRAPAWVLGVAVGLTASTKYTAAALLVPALAAVWLRPPREAGRLGPALCLAAGATGLALGAALASGLDAAVAARMHLKDARLLRPEHALSFLRGIGWTALVAGGALSVVAGLALAGRSWARRLARPDVVPLGLAAALAFVAGTPYAILKPLAFLSDLAFNHQTRFEYKGLVGASTSYGPYLGLLGEALTWPLLAAALSGALVALGRALRGHRGELVILLAALTPYLLVASSGHRAMRFLAPVFPAAAWLAGVGLSGLAPRLRRAAAGLVLARAALGAALLVRLFYVDSRVPAERWIEANIPPGAVIDLITNNPGYAPRIPEGRSLRVVPTLSREMAPPERFAEAAARYPAEAAPWLVLTASYYERFLDHPEQRPERAAFFRDLLEGRGGFEVVARFRQRGWLRPPAEFVDPEIVVLRKREAP